MSAALALYSRGAGPLPVEMMEETREMRAECNKRFKALLAAMEAGRAGQ